MPTLDTLEPLDASIRVDAGVFSEGYVDIPVGLPLPALGAGPLHDDGALDAAHDVNWLGLVLGAGLDLDDGLAFDPSAAWAIVSTKALLHEGSAAVTELYHLAHTPRMYTESNWYNIEFCS